LVDNTAPTETNASCTCRRPGWQRVSRTRRDTAVRYERQALIGIVLQPVSSPDAPPPLPASLRQASSTTPAGPPEQHAPGLQRIPSMTADMQAVQAAQAPGRGERAWEGGGCEGPHRNNGVVVELGVRGEVVRLDVVQVNGLCHACAPYTLTLTSSQACSSSVQRLGARAQRRRQPAGAQSRSNAKAHKQRACKDIGAAPSLPWLRHTVHLMT